MNDSFAGEFSSSQIASGGAAAEQKAEGIASVFVKHILETPMMETNFQMWGMTFGMVSCAVIVRSIQTSSTKITYVLEDHTGRIDAHFWLEEDSPQTTSDVMLNSYVKVYGSVRSQGSMKTLMLFKILPINDPNELCTHMLEMLNMRYRAEEYSTKSIDGFSDGFGANRNQAGSGFDAQSGGGGNNLGLDAKQLAVFQAIKNHSSEEGISRKELERKFAHMKNDLNNILDFMISEGHVYSSVDPDHFLSTE